MLVLARAALWGLLWADEGLMGRRAGAIHIAKAGVKRWWWDGQLELWRVRHGVRLEWVARASALRRLGKSGPTTGSCRAAAEVAAAI